MIFKPSYYFETGCAAYLLGCGGLGKCAVVDAHVEDIDAYVDFARSKGMQITHVIDTHVHADHLSGGPALAAKVSAQYCLHESASVALAFEPLRDGQETAVRHSPEEFIAALSEVPAKPAAMERMLRINAGRER
jgi:hydroxyacylglutathione hydrolase